MPPKKKKCYKLRQPGETCTKVNLKTSISFNEHEEDHYTSSPYNHKALVVKPQEIKQKLMIATNITLECQEVKNSLLSGIPIEGKYEATLNILNEFTNLPKEELKQIADRTVTRDRSFQKSLNDIRAIPELTLGMLADDIRTVLIKYIVDQKQFPTKMALLKDLKVLSSKYCVENIPIQRLVTSNLIKYQHFPEFNRYILTEHPKRAYQRTVYVNLVKEFRLQQKNFVYVEVRRITIRGSACGFIVGLAAIPNSGILEKFFTKDSVEPIAMKWMLQRILPCVTENSVIILSQPKLPNKLSPMGKKPDIIAWLDHNRIPYGKNPHTAELYNLYTTFKSKSKQQGLYDNVFLNAGYAVVHLPEQYRSLNFFRSVWETMNVTDGHYTGRPESLKLQIMNAINLLSKLNEVEECLIKEELTMMKEDRVMEDIVEKVQIMVKSGDVQQLDFSKECCGDKTDHFETHASNFIYDLI